MSRADDLARVFARPIAHRGLHDRAAGRIENTRSAAEAAIARGFAIECDVLLSADGEVVVFHDDDLDRLTGAHGPARDRTMAELATIRLEGADETIPSLAELLALVAGRVPLVVEIKSTFAAAPDTALVEAVARLAANYDGPLVTKSFDPRLVALANRLMPARAHGIVADRADDAEWRALVGSCRRRFVLRHLLHAAWSRPAFVSYCVGDLPAPAPWIARRVFGLPVMTWTVRTPADRTRARAHADQIVFEGFDPDVG